MDASTKVRADSLAIDRSELSDFWQYHLTNYQQSGKSQKSYCAGVGINVSTFRYHLYKGGVGKTGSALSSSEPSSSFLRLSPASATGLVDNDRGTHALVVRRGDVEYRFSSLPPLSYLESLFGQAS